MAGEFSVWERKSDGKWLSGGRTSGAEPRRRRRNMSVDVLELPLLHHPTQSRGQRPATQAAI